MATSKSNNISRKTRFLQFFDLFRLKSYKRYALTNVPLLSFLAVFLFSPNSFAASSAENSVSVEVTNACTVLLDRHEHAASPAAGTYLEQIDEPSTFQIACNDTNVYTIYAVGYSNDTEGQTKMMNLENPAGDIATGLAREGDVSNWAFKLFDNSKGVKILSDYANPSLIPDSSVAVAKREAGFKDPGDTGYDSFKVAYSIYTSKVQLPGTYTGKVKYTLFNQGISLSYKITYELNDAQTGPSPNPQEGEAVGGSVKLSGTTPVKDGFEFLGWCTVPTSDDSCSGETYGVGDNYPLKSDGNVVTLYARWKSLQPTTMQDFSDYCNKMNQGDTLTLTDIRDDNQYRVRKLRDNRCWMVDNLRLGGSSSMQLTSSDSDVSNAFVLPASSTSGFHDPDTANVYIDTSDNNYGGYYTWYAATAGTGSSSTASSGANATSSICPKGWRLPTGGPSGEFKTLADNYGNSSDGTAWSNALQDANGLNFLLTGFYSNGSTINRGVLSYRWSSTASSTNYAYSLYLNKSIVLPEVTNFVYYGVPMRCVARE